MNRQKINGIWGQKSWRKWSHLAEDWLNEEEWKWTVETLGMGVWETTELALSVLKRLSQQKAEEITAKWKRGRWGQGAKSGAKCYDGKIGGIGRNKH